MQYTSDGYAQALLAVIEQKTRSNRIWPYGTWKRLSAKNCSKLESGLISDVTAIEDEAKVVFTRPIYSGKAFEKKIVTDGFIICNNSSKQYCAICKR